MRIGIVIGRIGGVDGVALETEKWIKVLKRIGHECYILSGELEAEISNVELLKELSFFDENCLKDQNDVFFKQDIEENILLERIYSGAEFIKQEILSWINRNKIEVLLTENSTTLPCHLTMGLALKKVMEETNINSVSHNHDFAWERGTRYKTRYSGVEEIIKECFPPNLPNLKHAVINSNCFKILLNKTGNKPLMVPNVMDFDENFGELDDYNKELYDILPISKSDIPIFQITRIVQRKGIETAIELVKRINDKRVKLFITGNDKDEGQMYCSNLKKLVKNLDLQNQIFFVSDIFDNVRKFKNGKKIFALSDGYAIAKAITYFSTYEGFGNGYLEAVVAKKPIFVNNYKPVYWEDIGSKGFKTVQIENSELTDESVNKIKEILFDADKSREIGESNFNLGRKYFSYQVLEKLLKELFTF